ncbi:DNA-binding NarL/FixJ family response regulator [Mesonia hippocampi]|uniref:DNA-binding NarL/FixJ family response regulator n=1 Tax=Mesonia hippocampi TaxID=1628250 RepID=A0A840EVB1_9FLAO|nr:response regulator transcription factor [Mesonia hippocampi]MBB4118807.1 DNA-binding NarL/FixJ family response regulator [Mesonia hippocampi]
MKKPSILLADDHPLILKGTTDFLGSKNYPILATTNNGQKAYNLIVKLKPDIAILDYDMPKLNGQEIALKIKHNKLATKVVLLTLHKQESLLHEVGKSLTAYLTKDAALEELETCLNTIQQGDTYIGKRLQKNTQLNTASQTLAKLSTTEVKILKYINQNLTSTQIAEELFISKRTVEKHRSNIIRKLGLGSTPNALIIWLKQQPTIFD